MIVAGLLEMDLSREKSCNIPGILMGLKGFNSLERKK